jgi:hypothetical protein
MSATEITMALAVIMFFACVVLGLILATIFILL